MSHYFNVTDGSDQACADAVMQYWTGNTASFVPVGSNWTCGSEVQYIDSLDGTLVKTESISPATIVGTDTQQLLPPASQILVKWQTGTIVAGKRIVGRTFIPLRTEGDNDANGQVSGVTVTAINARNNSFLAGVTTPMVWSRKNGEAYPIQGASVNSAWSVLRSRRSV